ncbi:outer membrane lipoprotein carrier protein LolA [Alcanivorax sp. HI0083]|uniref:outer membrane lipoprotein chaperone LolA n=1 Tax=unclassified Alcanivorax TaxID=2638842 RepID=UPI0007B886E0|nr:MULTISPECIES: outer membrane lipoprotein chaperone LolA [unclassified Alcanivorax]KZY31625.1 outer membrane lipoprotein carrier protein LolA [Alcanivorax sp. HI0044]KZZ28270.1 outer membrane lipoprotein carrier protein LolA [Alcanivorax sp. HI0083]
MKKLLLSLALAPAVLLAPTAWAGATDDLLDRLQTLKSMKGEFEQVVLDQGGTHMQEATGRFQVARGNQFYWLTETPYEQMAASDGETVWVYDKDLEQVVVRPLSQDLGQTPALLFGGKPADVAKAFSISERDNQGGEVTYRLTPKGQDPLFDQLDVTFKGDEPASMRLQDALGQQTVIDFKTLTLNGGIDSGLFHFEPPEGTDVIQQQQ